MDDRKLHAFLVTLLLGSFSKAAVELSCTQSAVTQMMNALENELGCKLLARDHSGVRLTAAGEALLPTITQADAALSRLVRQAGQVAAGEAAHIRIGSFSSISNTWLPRVLRTYREKHPDTTFEIRIGTDLLTKWLQEGTVDLALGDEERCGAFRWYPLMDDPYCAVLPNVLLPKDHRPYITQEEFARYPYITAPMNGLDEQLTCLPEDRLTVTCDDDSTVLSMVAQGLGVTGMPMLSLKHLAPELTTLELHPTVTRTLGVALPKNPSKAASALAAHMRGAFSYGKGHA